MSEPNRHADARCPENDPRFESGRANQQDATPWPGQQRCCTNGKGSHPKAVQVNYGRTGKVTPDSSQQRPSFIVSPPHCLATLGGINPHACREDSSQSQFRGTPRKNMGSGCLRGRFLSGCRNRDRYDHGGDKDRYPLQAHPAPTVQFWFRAMHVSPQAFPSRQILQQDPVPVSHPGTEPVKASELLMAQSQNSRLMDCQSAAWANRSPVKVSRSPAKVVPDERIER